MSDLRETSSLASDDEGGEACGDLVTLERRKSRRDQAPRRGSMLLWAGVLGGAVLGAVASVALMRNGGEIQGNVAQANDAMESGRPEAVAPLPYLVRAQPVQVADAVWSSPPARPSAVAEEVGAIVPDSVEATSALARGESETTRSAGQKVSEPAKAYLGEQDKEFSGEAAAALALGDPTPTALDPGHLPALNSQDAALPASVEASQVETSPAPPTRAFTRSEMAAFLDRANDRLRVGDIGGARRILEYAGSGESGEAVFLLAKTYDPAALTAWGARSVKPDTEMARSLYQRALELGMTRAQERLAVLPPPT